MSGELLVVRQGEGESLWLGGLGVNFKVLGEQTDGLLSIVEHPIEPGYLVPPHVHSKEHELSYVLEGRVGARVGDTVVELSAGSYVMKPKAIPHTFWNATAEPARLIELIFPAAFERFFAAVGATDPAKAGERREGLADSYGLRYLPEWIPELKARYGLHLLGE